MKMRRSLQLLALRGLVGLVAVGAIPTCMAQSRQQAGENVQYDLRKIPFSRYGSFLEFRYEHATGSILPPDGVFLRTVHGFNSPVRDLFRVELLANGEPVPFAQIATPTLLTLKTKGGEAEFFFADANRIRFRARGVSVRFATADAPGALLDKFAEPVDRPNASARVWDYNASFEVDMMLRFSLLTGGLQVENTWDGRTSGKVGFTFSPDDGSSTEGQIEEFNSSYHPDGPGPYTVPAFMLKSKEAVSDQKEPSESKPLPQPRQSAAPQIQFDKELARIREEYGNWLRKMPAVPPERQKMADLAAYVSWSAVVQAQGLYTRPSMLMSKSFMTNLWSWDNSFNTMALASAHPQLAWDQLMWVFDSANIDGISPDFENDRNYEWTFFKPPVQGLTLAYFEQQNPGFFRNRARLEKLYPALAKRTEWYLRYRDWDGDGLAEYDHGNDSGWDNATLFLQLPPLETPDLAAFLVLQMEELSHIADLLNRPDESQSWKSRADAMRQRLLDKLWQGDHFVALHEGDHKVVNADSLILQLPIMLGDQLPKDVREAVIRTLHQPGHFLTPHGLATEGLSSRYLTRDGYWRGPIWAPSTMLIVEGLDAAGDHAFADELRRRFCDMVEKGGFSENFDPQTGQPWDDPSYTWTSSVYLIFAHELQTHTAGQFRARGGWVALTN